MPTADSDFTKYFVEQDGEALATAIKEQTSTVSTNPLALGPLNKNDSTIIFQGANKSISGK